MSEYFCLTPNLAHRKSIDLANHVPSFTPYNVVVTVRRFSEFRVVAASKKRRTELFDAEEALRRFYEEESDREGISSGEESDLDRQLYNMDEDLR